MSYAVSCNGKLYIISLDNIDGVAGEIRRILEETLGKKVIAYSFIEIHGEEYESNDLPMDHPEKRIFFYDNKTPIRGEYRFPNKDIVILD